jgi:hypothetical protein
MTTAPEPAAPDTTPVPANPDLPAAAAPGNSPDQPQNDDQDSAENLPARGTGRSAASVIGAAAGAALNFLTLTARVAALTTSALHLKERMHSMVTETERNAGKARNLSEMCDAAGVEPQYTALILESSTALHRVADSARDVAETADRTELHARLLGDAHEAEYRGIYEAVNASGVQQPKAGFNAVR